MKHKQNRKSLCRYCARISLTITSVLILSSNNVICQNDYFDEMANPAGSAAVSASSEDMIIHSPMQNALNTKLDSLDVICGKEYMTVRAEFNGPFNGIIFSKGTYGQSKCVYVKPHSGLTHATFNVRYDECGTKPDLQGKYFENTIVIQYGTDIIEAYDEAKRLRCEWFEAYEKPATFRPAIPVADLDIIEMNFQGDEIDCWMSIQEGKGPWSNEINRIVTVGQPLTIVVAINDKKNQFDMKVKSCFAHDGVKAPIYLIDEDGCILRTKMISPFQKIRNIKGKASLISYAQFLAFKFPDSVDVQIQCTVEVCRHGCVDTCNDGISSSALPNNHQSQNIHHRNSFHPDNKVHQIENVTTRFVMDKDDLLESANTNRNPVAKAPEEILIDENVPPLTPLLVDDEKQNYLEVIADYLQNVDNKQHQQKPQKEDSPSNDYQPEPISLNTPPSAINNVHQLNHEQSQHSPQFSVHPTEQNKNRPIPAPGPHGPSGQHLPNIKPQQRPRKPPPPPPMSPVSSEPVAQIMNIPLSPIYSVPMPLTMAPGPRGPPINKQNGISSPSFTSLLNPFNGIKLFNKKNNYIPQILSNYFNQKPKPNYMPNDNFDLLMNPNPAPAGQLFRARRFINDKQGEIGLKKGFQVVTTLDLSFSPNMSQDQMQVFEGKPEAIVYGICFSSTYFIYAIATVISIIFSAIIISIFIVYKLEKIKIKNRC